MFERYTEKARRVIFFARYEASTFGSPYIESQHLLLGILREDKALANQFLKTHAAIDSIRVQIESQSVRQPSISTSVDLPLSHESKRVLAYAAEESERLRHAFISPGHLFLALMREEKSLASTLLRERGLDAASVREELARSTAESPGPSAYELPPDLTNLLAQLRGLKGVTVAKNPTVGASRPEVAIYQGQVALTDGEILGDDQALQDKPSTPAEEMLLIRQRIKFIVKGMENAIANHQFEKARAYSDEERKERDNLRILMEHNLPEPGVTLPAPCLCIEVIRNEPFVVMQRRIDGYLAEGVAQVWTLDLKSKRAYTSTREEGLREVKGDTLRLAQLPIELDLKATFG